MPACRAPFCEVLGQRSPRDEVIAAWAAAYQQLADILIGAGARCNELTAATEAAGVVRDVPSRWCAKRPKAPRSRPSYLEPVDGGAVIAHQPGQYIGLRVVVDRPGTAPQIHFAVGARQRQELSYQRQARGRRQVSKPFARPGCMWAIRWNCSRLPAIFTRAIMPSPGADLAAVWVSRPRCPCCRPRCPRGARDHLHPCARDRGVHAFREKIDALANSHEQLTRAAIATTRRTRATRSMPRALLSTDRLARSGCPSRAMPMSASWARAASCAVSTVAARAWERARCNYAEFFGPAEALA